MSSSEVGVAEHWSHAGRQPSGGSAVRLIDLPADAGKSLGVFDELHGLGSAAAFADEIQRLCEQSHGVAALPFAREVAKRYDELRAELPNRIGSMGRAWLEEAGLPLHGRNIRCAQRFALAAVAGELASQFEVVAWQAGEATRAARRCFSAWTDEQTMVDHFDSAVDIVKTFIARHSNSRFVHLDQTDDVPKVTNVAGWRNDDEILIAGTAFRDDVCKGVNPDTVCRELAQRGFLVTGMDKGKTRFTVKRRVPGFMKHMRVYAVRMSIFEETDIPEPDFDDL